MMYSEKNTREHPLAQKYKDEAIILLHEILSRDGAKNCFFKDEIVIDLDKVETIKKSKSGCNRCETMDFCMGLSSNQILLVEIKLNVVRPTNLVKSQLLNKINHSKELLGYEIVISKDKVFLFKDKVIGVAKYYLSRMFVNSPSLKVLTIDDFKKTYFQD